MTVIIVGLSSATTLIFSNLRLQEISLNRVIGANLAREGIEIAKSLRDSNWLSGNAFDDGMGSTGDATGVPLWQDGQITGFSFTADDIDDSEAAIIISDHASSSLLYVNETAGHPKDADTMYRRLITFERICDDGSLQAEGVMCPAPLFAVGLRVTSQVVWDFRGKRSESVIVDNLYDWR